MVEYIRSNYYRSKDAYSGLSAENEQIYLKLKKKAREVHEILKKCNHKSFLAPYDEGAYASNFHATQILDLNNENNTKHNNAAKRKIKY